MDLAQSTPLTKDNHAPSAQPTVLWVPTAKTGLMMWLTTVDHKKIGFLYGFFALIFFIVGGFEALLIRAQLMFCATIQHHVHDAWDDDDLLGRDAAFGRVF